jgi:predicted patatin/cPLA2 family phospholipase
MAERARTGSKRGKRADDFHLALVIECGGMRGVAAGGFIKVLSEATLLDSFDTLHGSSSGACAAAYFLAGQIEEGRKIYYDDISTRKIVNPWRLFSRPCMVDTDYIVDKIIAAKRRLDTERIISEPGALNIITTSVIDGLPIVHKKFETSEQILLALKATLRIPGPLEPGVEINGRHQLDGGLVAPIPIFSAVHSGATHVLVICTQRAQDYAIGKMSTFIGGLTLGTIYNSRLKEAYLTAQRIGRQVRSVNWCSTMEIDWLVRSADSNYCGWFTIDKGVLKNVEKDSIRAAQAYLKDTSARKTLSRS